MFDWGRLRIERGKSGVVTVRIPAELLELARREVGVDGEGWDDEGRQRVERWLVDRISEAFHLPVVEQPGTSWFHTNGEGLLVFLTR